MGAGEKRGGGACKHYFEYLIQVYQLLVYSLIGRRNTEELDKDLIKVLERLEKKNLTWNADKRTFRMAKIVLMGLLLTKHEIGPMEEKVKAITEASKPQSPSEDCSFLGLVGFSAGFIPEFSTIADPLRKIASQGRAVYVG